MMKTAPLAKLLRQNLKRNVKSLLLSAFGIAVGIAAFVFFWGLSAGVSRVVLHDIFPIDRVEVIAPKTSLTGFTATLNDGTVEQIAARPEVKAAFPKMKMAFPAKGGGRLLGSNVAFEVGGFCDGMDPSLLDGDPGAEVFKDWEELEKGKLVPCARPQEAPPGSPAQPVCAQNYYCGQDGMCHHRVPVLVSRTLVELYNANFAPAHGMPKIGAVQEAALQGTMRSLRFNIMLGESFVAGSTDNLKAPPRMVEAMLVGISNKAMPIGMTVPIGYIRRWNEAYKGPESARTYSSIVVDLRDRSMLSSFLPWLKLQGLEQEESQAERISLVITIVTALFLLIAFTIMFISAVNISHTFFMMVSERRREIGLMRAVGASRLDIWKIVLGEAAVMGLVAGTAGVLAALGLARAIDLFSGRNLPDYPFKPETYFTFSPGLLALAIGFAILFCVVGASLPARKAASIHPAQALSG
jgi:putative ABC transport system permease protein